MKTCPQCLEEFEGRSNRIYCSDSCKMEAYQQRHEGMDDNSSQDGSHKMITNRDTKGSKLSSKEIDLRKHELDLEHQRKLLEFEQKQKELDLRAKELEMTKKREADKIAAIKAKKEKELELQRLKEAKLKAFSPIKLAIQDILTEIIENGKDSVLPIVKVEELIEYIEDTIDKIRKYYQDKPSSYRDSLFFNSLNDLRQELKEILSDDDFFESEDEVVIDFKKSYLRELQTVLQELENGLHNHL